MVKEKQLEACSRFGLREENSYPGTIDKRITLLLSLQMKGEELHVNKS